MSIDRRLLDPAVLARLANIPLDSRRPMTGTVAGRHRSIMRGSGLEFAQYRKYVPGDDTRRLDWRLWGRSDRCYIKEFETDTNLRLCIVLDLSGSMSYGPNGTVDPMQQKLHYACQLASTLAWLAAKQGDALGLYCAGNGQSAASIPPRRGARHMKTVLNRLESVECQGETCLDTALHDVAQRVPRRSLVVIISDLFVEPSTLANSIQHLRFRKHDIALFHLLDKDELEFQFDQPMRFLDLEGGLPMLADPALVGDAYREGVKNYFAELAEIVRNAEIDYQRAELDEDYATVLGRFLSARRSKLRSR
jgi:uncharacterized protein (DUF58 family)